MLKKQIIAGASLVSASIGSAFAAVPESVNTALTDAKSDALVVAGGFLVAVIAVAAFNLMRKGAH